MKEQRKLSNKLQGAKFNRCNCIPKALFREISKPLNIYFIITTIFTFIDKSPKTSAMATVTLISYLMLIVIKEVYEDLHRQRIEKQFNMTLVHVYNYSYMCYYLQPVQSLKVGDLISVEKDQCVPADILLLQAPTSLAYVDTSMINGEMSYREKFVINR